MFPVPQMFSYYDDLDGTALQGGYIYFGEPNQNPQNNPISIYWDLEGTLAAPQPLRTQNGYVVKNGSPANIFVNTDYSLSVYNSKRELVYYVQSALEAGAELPIFDDPISPTYLKTISDVLNGLEISLFRFIDPSKYESIRSGTNTDDLSVNINQAFSSGAKKIFVPYGTYNMSTTANIVTDGFGIRGEGVDATIFKCNAADTIGFSIADNLNGVTFDNFRITRSSLALPGGNGIDCANSTLSRCLINRVVSDNHYIGINLGESFDGLIENILSYSNQSHGIAIAGLTITGSNCKWDFSNVTSRNNDGHGIAIYNQVSSSPLILGNLINVSALFNKLNGINILATPTNGIYDFFYNGGLLTGNGLDNLRIQSYSGAINLSNIVTTFSGRTNCGVNGSTAPTLIGNGIYLDGANESCNMNGCSSNYNSYHGYRIASSAIGYVCVTGCSALDNGFNTGAGTFSGLSVENSGVPNRTFSIVGGFYGNTLGNTTTKYGISGINGSQVSIVGARLFNANIAPISFNINQNQVQLLCGLNFGDLFNQIDNIVVGAPTGGGVANGINLQSNIAKNGTVYTNP